MKIQWFRKYIDFLDLVSWWSTSWVCLAWQTRYLNVSPKVTNMFIRIGWHTTPLHPCGAKSERSCNYKTLPFFVADTHGIPWISNSYVIDIVNLSEFLPRFLKVMLPLCCCTAAPSACSPPPWFLAVQFVKVMRAPPITAAPPCRWKPRTGGWGSNP